MYTGLLHAHSGLRYLTLLLLLIVIGQSLIGWLRFKKYTHTHQRIAGANAWFLIIQFIVGLVLYVVSPKVMFDPIVFKNTMLRFFSMEHPLMMTIAISVILMSYFSAKPSGDYRVHKRLFWYHLAGMLLLVASIPWPFREQLGATWF